MKKIQFYDALHNTKGMAFKTAFEPSLIEGFNFYIPNHTLDTFLALDNNQKKALFTRDRLEMLKQACQSNSQIYFFNVPVTSKHFQNTNHVGLENKNLYQFALSLEILATKLYINFYKAYSDTGNTEEFQFSHWTAQLTQGILGNCAVRVAKRVKLLETAKTVVPADTQTKIATIDIAEIVGLSKHDISGAILQQVDGRLNITQEGAGTFQPTTNADLLIYQQNLYFCAFDCFISPHAAYNTMKPAALCMLYSYYKSQPNIILNYFTAQVYWAGLSSDTTNRFMTVWSDLGGKTWGRGSVNSSDKTFKYGSGIVYEQDGTSLSGALRFIGNSLSNQYTVIGDTLAIEVSTNTYDATVTSSPYFDIIVFYKGD